MSCSSPRPDLSVVTISFNDLEALKATVSSVHEQRGLSVEHLIIDGDSCDGTKEFLEDLETVTYWVSEPDKGRYDAMNKGARRARGTYLWFMHAGDTFADTDSAAKGVHGVEGTDWGYGLTRIVRNGATIGIGGSVRFDKTQFILGRTIIPHQAAVIRREFFFELGEYSLAFGLAEDQHLFMRALRYSQPRVVPDFLCNFDGDGAGSLRGVSKHVADFRRARRQESAVAVRSGWIDDLLGVAVGAEMSIRSYVRRMI